MLICPCRQGDAGLAGRACCSIPHCRFSVPAHRPPPKRLLLGGPGQERLESVRLVVHCVKYCQDHGAGKSLMQPRFVHVLQHVCRLSCTSTQTLRSARAGGSRLTSRSRTDCSREISTEMTETYKARPTMQMRAAQAGSAPNRQDARERLTCGVGVSVMEALRRFEQKLDLDGFEWKDDASIFGTIENARIQQGSDV